MVGRYAIFGPIASGGMGQVRYGRLVGPAGFSRTVAIKRLHEAMAEDAGVARAFLDEARLAARIKHPNVVSTLDVVEDEQELLLVMDYVPGASLAELARTCMERRENVPCSIAAAILCGVLEGLHAAHEAKDEKGRPLDIVHRDVSPQNVLVGADGISRVVDFGVAKAARRQSDETEAGRVKGKVAYMSPEQFLGEAVTRRADVFAAAVVLWELLTLRRMFGADGRGTYPLLSTVIEPPGHFRDDVPAALDAAILHALAEQSARFATARELGRAIEAAVPIAQPAAVAEWVERTAGPTLARRAAEVLAMESASGSDAHVPVAVAERQSGADALGDVTKTATGAVAAEDVATRVRPAQVEAKGTRHHISKRRRRAELYGAAAALVVLGLAGAVATRSLGARPAAPVASSVAPTASTAASPSPPVTSVESPSPSPPVTSVETPSPSPPASASPLPPLAASAASAKPSLPRSGRESKPSCVPPFRVDERGVRRVKPECL